MEKYACLYFSDEQLKDDIMLREVFDYAAMIRRKQLEYICKRVFLVDCNSTSLLIRFSNCITIFGENFYEKLRTSPEKIIAQVSLAIHMVLKLV